MGVPVKPSLMELPVIYDISMCTVTVLVSFLNMYCTQINCLIGIGAQFSAYCLNVFSKLLGVICVNFGSIIELDSQAGAQLKLFYFYVVLDRLYSGLPLNVWKVVVIVLSTIFIVVKFCLQPAKNWINTEIEKLE